MPLFCSAAWCWTSASLYCCTRNELVFTVFPRSGISSQYETKGPNSQRPETTKVGLLHIFHFLLHFELKIIFNNFIVFDTNTFNWEYIYWMYCILNENCAFESLVKVWWCVVQETICSHYISVKPEKHPVPARSQRRAFS